MSAARSGHVVVIGAGGNIGSHLTPHLARLPQVSRITLIDPGVYEGGNRHTQDITADDVGRPKVRVMARRLARIAPQLRVVAIASPVEEVELGRLRGDAIVTGLDTRAARQTVNDAAFHLGVTWIDSGVSADGLLARVNVFVPGPDQPCLECPWHDGDYDAVEVAYPCDPGPHAPPTGAPSSLGALAAALAAIELRKVLEGDLDHAAVARQVTFDALNHRCLVTRLTRRAGCRRGDHDPWTIEPLGAPGAVRLAGLAGLHGSDALLGVEGRLLERRAVCVRCGVERPRLRVAGTRRGRRQCASCGGALETPGFHRVSEIELGALGARERARTLESIGVRRGDVIRIAGATAIRRFEVGGRAQRQPI